jgi:hypothetical protein
MTITSEETLVKMKKHRCRTKRPDLLKALRLVGEIAMNNFCDCNDPAKKKAFCPTCEIYGIVHGALGCSGNRTCPVMLRGRAKIKSYKKKS